MKLHLFVFAILIALNSLARPQPLPQNIVSIKISNQGVRDSLERLLKGSGMKYQIDSSVPNEKKVSLDVRGAKWVDVFRFILNDADLIYQFDRDGKLIVSQAK